MKINAEWHVKNKMSKNPTVDERIAWHMAHAENCKCRPIHGKILEEINKRKNTMTRRIVKEAFIWGIILWLIGYILGIVLFAVVPASILGWVIMPIGVLITLWVLENKIKAGSFKYFLSLATVWTLIAVVFDYLFLVKVFKPEDGYYKLDVYLYYALTFALPILAWVRKQVGGNL